MSNDLPPPPIAVMTATRAALSVAQRRLGEWAVEALRSAGVPVLGLSIGAAPATGTWVLLLPLRIGTPGRSLDGGGTPLLSPPESNRDGPRHMPPAWADLARLIQAAVDPLIPRLDTRTQRPVAAPPAADLPRPLADWYRAAPPGWCGDAPLHRVRPPTLSWSAGTTLRVDYLLAVQAPPEELVPCMGVLSTALIHAGGIEIDGTPVSLDGPLAEFVEALAASALEPEAAALRATLDAALAPPPLRVALGFASDLSTPEIARVMNHFGAAAFPYLTPAIQLLAGPELHFAPSGQPNLRSRAHKRGEAE